MTCQGTNLTIKQGKTFRKAFGIGTGRKIYKPIISVTQAAPAIVESTGHGLNDGWAFHITGAKGMLQLNQQTAWPVLVVDADHLELNTLNSLNMPAYKGGGVIEYFEPRDLTSYTAAMQIRPSLDSSEVIATLTTGTGEILIDEATSILTLQLTAAVTADLDFETAVYDVELTAPSGEIVPGASGGVILEKAATQV